MVLSVGVSLVQEGDPAGGGQGGGEETKEGRRSDKGKGSKTIS